MLDELKKQVCQANLRLVEQGLVVETWGNASAIDRPSGNVVIKPSGVPYDSLSYKQMVVVELETGKPVEGDLRPSSDTPTHLELYRSFKSIGGVTHTHSLNATAWAQARREIPALGTTHADYFHGPIPCTRLLRPDEIQSEYELNTGKVIVERFSRHDPERLQAVLLADHGPFTWGCDVAHAVNIAVMVEHLALLALRTATIEPYPKPVSRELLDRHYYRKHGSNAYYGQSS